MGQHERRFEVTLLDKTGIDFGVVKMTCVVVAESPAEAEMYVRQILWDDCTAICDSVEMTTREIPTLN